MPNLDRTCSKADLVRKIKDGPGSNCLHWYKEFLSFSDANKLMSIVLWREPTYRFFIYLFICLLIYL